MISQPTHVATSFNGPDVPGSVECVARSQRKGPSASSLTAAGLVLHHAMLYSLSRPPGGRNDTYRAGAGTRPASRRHVHRRRSAVCSSVNIGRRSPRASGRRADGSDSLSWSSCTWRPAMRILGDAQSAAAARDEVLQRSVPGYSIAAHKSKGYSDAPGIPSSCRGTSVRGHAQSRFCRDLALHRALPASGRAPWFEA